MNLAFVSWRTASVTPPVSEHAFRWCAEERCTGSPCWAIPAGTANRQPFRSWAKIPPQCIKGGEYVRTWVETVDSQRLAPGPVFLAGWPRLRPGWARLAPSRLPRRR